MEQSPQAALIGSFGRSAGAAKDDIPVVISLGAGTGPTGSLWTEGVALANS